MLGSVNREVFCWGFFEGVSQGSTYLCGVGFLLHFSDSRLIKGKANLGPGTNNLGEFKALYALLKVALDKGVFLLNSANLAHGN